MKARNAKANLERKLAAHQKSLHGELVNDILKNGDVIKLEKLSYKAFQKLFGKSVGKKAPGMFVSHLKSKAQRAGGQMIEIPTHSTKLSQTCQCGRVKKKSLKERVHNCVCGVTAQRDLYSAFLAKLAAWCRYLNGYDDQNRPIPIDDPLADILTQQARSGKTDPRPLLSMFEIFGDLGHSPRFVETVADKLSSLHEFGAKGTLVRLS